MEEKLDFSLPQKKQISSIASVVIILLLIIVIALVLANLFIDFSGESSIVETSKYTLTAEKTKQLAARLAQRNLYNQAAKLWKDYLSASKLTDAERAKVLFQIGTLLEKAEQYAEAIEYYYRSEMAAKLNELESEINAHIKSCFERLGKFSALRYELMDRTNYKKTESAGGKIVAEIGAEKITEADLDALIENNIDNQLAQLSAFMTDEQLLQQKQEMLEQYKNLQAKQHFIQNWLAQEILYRQALEQRLIDKPEVKRLMDDLYRGVLSQQLVNKQLADKINITETDLQTYYAANKERYVEPARAKISHILVGDQEQAKDLIKRIKDGEDFEKLAQEFSQDSDTKEKGGRIEADVVKGSYVPKVGEVKEVNEKILQAEAGVVLDEPVKTDNGFEVIKIDEKQSQRQKSFDQVRQQVISELLTEKRQHVQREYIEQMMDKYNVIIHASVLIPTEQTGSQTEALDSKSP